MTIKTFFAAAAATLAFALPALAHDGVHIDEPYARIGPNSGAVFFTIENHATVEEKLVAAHSDVAKLTELHTHIADANGVMKMVPIEGGITIPAGEDHALARGGDHIMLMGLTQALKDGDTFSVTLSFEHAGDVTFDVTVDNSRMPAPAGGNGMGAMNMNGMTHDMSGDATQGN